MTYTFIKRIEDGLGIGHVRERETDFLATRTYEFNNAATWADRSQVTSEHADRDEAIAWVRANPYVPDPELYPFVCGIFGRQLARWGSRRIIGCVHLAQAYFAYNKLDIGAHAPTLLVVDDRHWIHARLDGVARGWDLRIRDLPTQMAGTWTEALDLFHAQVLHHMVSGSAHQRMQLLDQIPELTAATTTFAQERRDVRRQLYLDAPGAIWS